LSTLGKRDNHISLNELVLHIRASAFMLLSFVMGLILASAFVVLNQIYKKIVNVS